MNSIDMGISKISGGNIIFKTIVVISIIFFSLYYIMLGEDGDLRYLPIFLLHAFVISLLFLLKKESFPQLKGKYLRHSILALIGIWIVFFQVPIDYVLGNVKPNNLFLFVNQNIILKSFVLSIIGLLCFFWGNLSAKISKRRLIEKKERVIKVNGLILLSFVSLGLYFFTVNPLYLAGYYQDVGIGTTAYYFVNFFNIFIFSSFIQRCRNLKVAGVKIKSFGAYLRYIGWPILCLILIYLMSVVLSGDRGPIIVYSLLIISGFLFVTRIKIRVIYLVLLFLLGSIAMTVLGIARGGGKRGLSFGEKILSSIEGGSVTPQRYGYVSFLPYTQELSLSYNALNTVVDYVPKYHDFFYGRFQVQRIFVIVPFASIFYPLIFKDNSAKFQTSSSYITWIQQGNFPTYGSGTSAMADLYLDFGLAGVMIGMFFFGYFMRLSEVAMYVTSFPSLFMQVFFMVYLSYVIYISRSSILANLLMVVWIYLILSINKFAYEKFSNS